VLEKELQAISDDIGALVRASPVWRATDGISWSLSQAWPNKTSTSLLAEVPEIGGLTRSANRQPRRAGTVHAFNRSLEG